MSVRENLEMGAYLVAGQAEKARMQEVFSLFPILRERERHRRRFFPAASSRCWPSGAR